MKTTKKYDLIFSIGAACSCATTLKNLDLRKMSSPFDWLYGSTFTDRIDFLLDDFVFFLEKEDLEFAHKEESIFCDAYLNKRTNIVFNHDFSSKIPFDSAYTIVKEKYAKRIKRLLNAIEESNSTLLVYIEQNKSNIVENDILEKKHSQLATKYPNNNIELLYICHNEENKIKTLANGKISIICGNYKSKKVNAKEHEVDTKILKKYFKNIKLNISFGQYLKFKICKVIINLIPIKSCRHKAREKFHV